MPTALVVDDHPAIRLAVRSRLTEDLDFDTVTEVTNGADALRVLRDAIADLIVVDLSLPGVPGEALLAELVSRHPATRVLVLSAMTGAGERAIHGAPMGMSTRATACTHSRRPCAPSCRASRCFPRTCCPRCGASRPWPATPRAF